MADYMKRVLPNNIKISETKESLKIEELDMYEKNKLTTANKKWQIICKAKNLKNTGMSK